MVVLSILIPTRNRRASLGRLLNRLERSDLPEVEVIVSDNASEDGTDELIFSVQRGWKGSSSMRAFRQPENVGFDGNLATLLELSSGRYVYYLSDDDSPNTRRLSKIVKELSNCSAGMLITHHYRTTRLALEHFSSIPIVPLSDSSATTNLKVGKSCEVSTPEETLCLMLLGGQISSAIYKRPEANFSDHVAMQMRTMGGGVGQFLLASHALSEYPRYFISRKSWVRIGKKYDFSEWFMESGLLGAPLLLAGHLRNKEALGVLGLYAATEYARWAMSAFEDKDKKRILSKMDLL